STRANFVASAERHTASESGLETHAANDSSAHGIDALLLSKADYDAHKINETDAHGIDGIQTDLDALENEIFDSRGTKSTVADRLDISLQADGLLKLSSVQTVWLNNSDVPTWVSSKSFTVPGDRTGIYIAGVILKLEVVGTGYVYGKISSSSYSSPNTTVTLLDTYAVLGAGPLGATLQFALFEFSNNLELSIAQNSAAILSLQNQVSSYMLLGARVISESGAVQPTDQLLLVDASSGSVDISLPAIADSDDRVLVFKRIDNSVNSVGVSGDGNVDGAASFSLDTQYALKTIRAYETNWYVI
ncbi:MAG: hypothetical protein WA151_16095, partial [Desulfatirhabdiaceae bacterium]